VTTRLEVVAHRGVHDELPENTIASFQRALDLGVDAIELDVRLTRDGVPVVYHYFYLDDATNGFAHTFEQTRRLKTRGPDGKISPFGIPTFEEVIATFAGRIGMEIELKGPEPESAEIVAKVLRQFEGVWSTIEVTSYEPALLLEVQRRCPCLATDLLLPRSEPWMNLDVCAYWALQRGRLARARAVHLHPTQLSSEAVATIRSGGLDVHAWDVNDEESLAHVAEVGISKVCTDRPAFVVARYLRDTPDREVPRYGINQR
jgi:glycerophosphoryl diester phosphodiesterase